MKLLFTVSLLFMSLIAYARQISPVEAEAIASEFLSSTELQPNLKRILAAKSKPEKTNEASPYYIFNAEDACGFVIVSGDDRLTKIIGYSDTGSIDIDNMPPQLSAMLSQITEQLKSLPETQPADSSWRTRSHRIADKVILLETENWGQGYPYNTECPVVDGIQCPTGCVATAMAIVMKYHNWPDNGRGYFEPKQDDIYIEYDGFNCSSHNFGWKNCSNENAKGQIAKNMSAIGKTILTNYTPDASTAFVTKIGPKFHSFFKYSPSCQNLYRKNWDDDEWYDIIRSQIDNNSPIIYFGSNSETDREFPRGEHAFVLDGYNQNNYFHFNFGWEGACNGWYTLNASGNNPSPYLSEEGMTINIIPSDNIDIVALFTDNGHYWEYDVPASQSGSFYIYKDAKSTRLYSNRIQIYSPTEFKGKIGIALYNKNNELKEIAQTIDVDNDFFRNDFVFKDFEFSNTIESDSISIVYKRDTDNSWHKIQGTLEAPATISVNSEPRYSYFSWNIDAGIEIEQIIQEPSLVADMSGGLPKKLLANQYYFFKAYLPNGRMGRVRIISPDEDNFHCHRVYENFDIMEFTVCTNTDKSIEVILINNEDIEHTAYIDNTDDSYFDYWPLEEVERVKRLKVIGNIGFWEYMFITNWMFGLKTLDLSEANLGRPNFGNANMSYLQYLEEVHYPKDYRHMQTKGEGLESNWRIVGLPVGLERIDSDFSYSKIYNTTKKTFLVICHNPQPPYLESLEQKPEEYFTAATNSILMVPKGSKEVYKTTEGWKNFGEIIEFEGDWHQYISMEDLNSIVSTPSDNECKFSIYNIQGICIKQNAKQDEVRNLSPGLYIINGKKIYVRLN